MKNSKLLKIRNWNLELGNSKRSWAGFTFIELMVVVAIIGILSTMFVTQSPAVQRRARDTERRNAIKQYQTGIEAYANRNNGNYVNTGGTINPSGTFCSTTLGLPACPDDTDTTKDYQVNSTTTQYVLWAMLDQPPTSVTYFYACSTGESGDSTAAPSGSNCPL